MTTLEPTHSLEDVAEALDETPRYVADRCRRGDWPHSRGSRGRIKFTSAQYAEILALIAQAPATDAELPRLSFAPRSRRRAS